MKNKKNKNSKLSLKITASERKKLFDDFNSIPITKYWYYDDSGSLCCFVKEGY